MNFSSTLEKIESSEAFKNFKKAHEDAELCAGFFIIDYEQGEQANQQQLDYCLKNRKIFTFLADKEITVKEAETIEGKREKLPKLNKEIKIDIEDIENIVKEKMKQEKISNKINKIIAVLQKHQDKQIWNLNCMLEGMGILQVHIDTESGEILKFEKRSMFDFIKRVK